MYSTSLFFIPAFILSSSLAATSAATIPSATHFTITKAILYTPSSATGNDTVLIDITDHKTRTNTTCEAIFSTSKTPSPWFVCEDPTFKIRYDGFSGPDDSGWNVELKHVSKAGGKACLSPTGPKCYAKLGYANVTSSVPGFYNECGESGACVYGTAGSFNATVYETKLAGKVVS